MCELLSILGETSTAIFYPEGYHMLLRDRQRETVLRDLAAWIADREAPPPSGLGHDCR
jgi:alpha-beta hydrolase superfamily lysophospholipase